MNVPTGGIYGFIGPNGAGKTTTIELIMGLAGSDGGTMQVFGLDPLREEVAVKRQIGYASPDIPYNSWSSVKDVVNFFRPFYDDWDDRYCLELMARFRLEQNAGPGTLSTGARTKLGLLLALSHRPTLLLLDEPMSGLDAVSKEAVFRELLEAVQDERRTVLISSHGLHDLERYADTIGILHKGTMLLEGSTAELIERFRMVDCLPPIAAMPPPPIPGTYFQRELTNHWNLLLDTTRTTAEELVAMGCTEIHETPVTLEQLFVALVKE